jgi:hypothetical protein
VPAAATLRVASKPPHRSGVNENSRDSGVVIRGPAPPRGRGEREKEKLPVGGCRPNRPLATGFFGVAVRDSRLADLTPRHKPHEIALTLCLRRAKRMMPKLLRRHLAEEIVEQVQRVNGRVARLDESAADDRACSAEGRPSSVRTRCVCALVRVRTLLGGSVYRSKGYLVLIDKAERRFRSASSKAHPPSTRIRRKRSGR